MATSLRGTVHGDTVTLDQAVPPLDGQRVLVLLEPLEETVVPAPVLAEAWLQWAAREDEGPLDDDNGRDFP